MMAAECSLYLAGHPAGLWPSGPGVGLGLGRVRGRETRVSPITRARPFCQSRVASCRAAGPRSL